MSTRSLTQTDSTVDPTTPAYNVDPECDDCGADFPCFDHHRAPCPNGRYDCNGPMTAGACARCQRAVVAAGRFRW